VEEWFVADVWVFEFAVGDVELAFAVDAVEAVEACAVEVNEFCCLFGGCGGCGVSDAVVVFFGVFVGEFG
jgi:hypothetical protein